MTPCCAACHHALQVQAAHADELQGRDLSGVGNVGKGQAVAMQVGLTLQ
jgi:hypothetical protein